MAALSGWVKEILVLALLGWLLESVMPTERFRPYVRIFIGLLLIVVVIRPVFSAVRHAPYATLPALSSSPVASTLVHQGVLNKQQGEAKVAQIFAEKLGDQAKALAFAASGIAGITAKVTVVEAPSSPNFGSIEKVVLTLPATAGVQVPTIRVGGPQAPAKPPPAIVAKIKAEVAAGLGIDPKIITVQKEGPR